MDANNVKKNKLLVDVNVRKLCYFLMSVGFLCFLVMLYLSMQTVNRYRILDKKTYEYILVQENINEFIEASDYLTSQSQQAVITGRPSNMYSYVGEVNISRRRENAIDKMRNAVADLDGRVIEDLENALKVSNSLMVDEMKAMKLIARYHRINESVYPSDIVKTELDKYEDTMSPFELKERANEYVFGMRYMAQKELIANYIDSANKRVIVTLKNSVDDAQQSFNSKGKQLGVCAVICFLIMMGSGVVYLMFVINPMSRAIKSIENDELMVRSKSKEMNLLADAYNEMFKQHTETRMKLQNEAEHDGLTGLLNRKAYQKLCAFYQDSETKLALIIIDIDKFKNVNDEFGHKVGDEAIKVVGSYIRESFRNVDYVIRYGGDEFVVLMVNLTIEQRSIIEKKIDHINVTLLNGGTEEFPALSISAGVAFSTDGFSQDLFARADKALYHTKENGRCGYTFYSDYLKDITETVADSKDEEE